VKNLWVFFLIATLILVAAVSAGAAPIEWTADPRTPNHWYEAVCPPSGINFTNASAAATAAGGYLAPPPRPTKTLLSIPC
jgi:hypothetical protein